MLLSLLRCHAAVSRALICKNLHSKLLEHFKRVGLVFVHQALRLVVNVLIRILKINGLGSAGSLARGRPLGVVVLEQIVPCS